MVIDKIAKICISFLFEGYLGTQPDPLEFPWIEPSRGPSLSNLWPESGNLYHIHHLLLHSKEECPDCERILAQDQGAGLMCNILAIHII